MTDATVNPSLTRTDAATPGSLADQARGALSGLGSPGGLVDQAKGFAKARPWASAALAGVVGIALLNTLRGK